MQAVLNAIPADVFWSLVIGWLLGGATIWRFARYVERIRDAVNHARHHLARSADFWKTASRSFAGLVAASVIVLISVALIGSLVWVRLAGG